MNGKYENTGFFEFDIINQTTYYAHNFYTMFGYDVNEFEPTYDNGVKLIYPEDLQKATEAFNRALEGEVYFVQKRMICKNGDIIEVESNGTLIYDKSGKPIRLVAVLLDVTRRNEIKRLLAQNEEKYRKVFNSYLDVYYESDKTGKIEIVSPSVTETFGFKPTDIIGKKVSSFYKDTQTAKKIASLINESGKVKNLSTTIYDKNGEERNIEANCNIRFNENGEPDGIVGVIRDVSKRVKADTNLKEKEILLKEIHHRVKNNLQIIMSFLEFEALKFKDSEFNSIMRNTQNRILSMSLIHEILYSKDDFNSIGVSNYVTKLVEQIATTLKCSKKQITTSINIEPTIKLNLDKGIVLGLILNELITNSIKYAFPNNEKGIIKISITKTSEKHFLVSYSDNGIGYGSAVKKGLGTMLILKLIKQLKSTPIVNTENGYNIKFNV